MVRGASWYGLGRLGFYSRDSSGGQARRRRSGAQGRTHFPCAEAMVIRCIADPFRGRQLRYSAQLSYSTAAYTARHSSGGERGRTAVVVAN